MLAKSLVMRLETGDGRCIYAARNRGNDTAAEPWLLSMPRGAEARMDGTAADVADEMRRVAAESFGGAGPLWAKGMYEPWVPYEPGLSGPGAEKRRAEAAKSGVSRAVRRARPEVLAALPKWAAWRAEGKTYRAIGLLSGVSEDTVRFHLKRLRQGAA